MDFDTKEIEKSVFQWVEESFEDVFVVDVKCIKGKHSLLRVEVDKDSGISISDCTLINRKLQEWLSRYPEFTQYYRIEVTSPGLSEPFKVLRQYAKNVGRNIDITLVSGEKTNGKLLAVHPEEGTILIQAPQGSSKKEKKKENLSSLTKLSLAEVKQCFVEIKI
jgi:ribosome maturation factor RimP